MTDQNPEGIKDDVIVPTPGTIGRRAEYKEDARDGDGDGLVQDGTPFERPVGTTLEVEEVVVEKKPAAKKPAAKDSELPAVELLAAAFVESEDRKNSMTVAWAQDRLTELGYGSARGDLSGWYSSGTAAAVAAFQKDKGLKSHEVRETLEALVAGTKASVV